MSVFGALQGGICAHLGLWCVCGSNSTGRAQVRRLRVQKSMEEKRRPTPDHPLLPTQSVQKRKRFVSIVFLSVQTFITAAQYTGTQICVSGAPDMKSLWSGSHLTSTRCTSWFHKVFDLFKHSCWPSVQRTWDIFFYLIFFSKYVLFPASHS